MDINGKEWERRPFLAIPDVGSYYPASSIQAARESVFRTLERAEGTALVFGGTGLGKTLLLKLAASEFEIDGPVILFNGLRTMDRAGFLARILFELHQSIAANDENALRIALFDFLRRSEYRRFVLLIDEAQSLPFSAFEEIRLLLDQESFREPLFRVALAGTEAFEERLTHPRLARFSQRIVSRSYLEPFLRDETGDYIDRQIRMAGGRFSETHFDSEAKIFVHRSAEGVPRVINQLCDLALWLGPNENGVFSEQILRKAWGMLQQLPEENRSAGAVKNSSGAADSNTVSGSDSSPAVIEFGTLDEGVSDLGASTGVEFGTLDDEEPKGSAPSLSVETDSPSDSINETVRIDEEQTEPETDESSESELFSIQFDAAHSAKASDDFSDNEEEDEEFSSPVSDYDRLIGERLSENRSDSFTDDSAFDPPHAAVFSFDSEKDTPLGDDRLEELRLMEMEVAQEAALIRKIRDMHSGLESFRGSSPTDSSPANAVPTPDEPADSDSSRKYPGGSVRAPYRPAAGSRRFRSAFKRLYPEE